MNFIFWYLGLLVGVVVFEPDFAIKLAGLAAIFVYILLNRKGVML